MELGCSLLGGVDGRAQETVNSRVAIAASLSAQLNKQFVSKSFLLPRHGRDLKCNLVHIFHLQHTVRETDSETVRQTVRQTVRDRQ